MNEPTEDDRQYASELLADLANGGLPKLEIAARWFSKARRESALGDKLHAVQQRAARCPCDDAGFPDSCDNCDRKMLARLPLEYIEGQDFCTVRDATGADFALTIRPQLMQLMERALIAEFDAFMKAPPPRS
jgi:hypothetical protein